MNWINVKEELPDKPQKVLCLPKGMQFDQIILQYNPTTKTFHKIEHFYTGIGSLPIEISHWMLLPERPEGK